MSNIGDLVTSVSCDASSYPQGTNLAINSNKALSGSIDSIIGQLQRQKREFDKQGKTTQDNILGSAAKGAGEGQINHALQLNDDVTALKNKAAAEREAAQAAQDAQNIRNQQAAAGASLLSSLRDEEATLKMTADEIRIYKAEQAGLNPVTIAAARGIQAKIAALREESIAEQDAIAKKVAAKQAGESLVATLQREKALHGMTAGQLQLYRAQQQGATGAEIARARALQSEIAALQAAKEAQEALNRETQRGSGGIAGMANKGMILTEVTRGMEDAVAGFTTNGLKGMLMGTTNNTNQIASLIGGTTGLALSVGSIGALIGVSLIPMLMKWGDKTEEIRKREKELADDQKKQHDDYMAQITERNASRSQRQDDSEDRRNLIGNQNAKPEALQSQLERDKAELRRTQREAQIVREQQNAMSQRQTSVQTDISTQHSLRNLDGFYTRSNSALLAEKEEESRELERKQEEAALRLRRLRIDEGNITRQIEETNAARVVAVKSDMDKKALEEAQREKDARLKIKADEAKKDAEIRKNSASVIEGAIRRKSPEAADEIDRQQRIKEEKSAIAKGVNSGLITKEDGLIANRAIEQKDTVPPGGPAAAVQSGSTAAYSAMVKAMNKGRDENFQRQAVEEAKTLVEIMKKIEAKDPIEATLISI